MFARVFAYTHLVASLVSIVSVLGVDVCAPPGVRPCVVSLMVCAIVLCVMHVSMCECVLQAPRLCTCLRELGSIRQSELADGRSFFLFGGLSPPYTGAVCSLSLSVTPLRPRGL